MAVKRGEGFQKPASNPGAREVGLAVITQGEDGRSHCSCGWSIYHAREKVREDAADRHLLKRHAGQGIRL